MLARTGSPPSPPGIVARGRPRRIAENTSGNDSGGTTAVRGPSRTSLTHPRGDSVLPPAPSEEQLNQLWSALRQERARLDDIQGGGTVTTTATASPSTIPETSNTAGGSYPPFQNSAAWLEQGRRLVSSSLGGCAPTEARVVSSFAAAGAHSAAGAMLQSFASALVALFTRGLQDVSGFPTAWERRLREERQELGEWVYELQGMGVLFAFVWTHVALLGTTAGTSTVGVPLASAAKTLGTSTEQTGMKAGLLVGGGASGDPNASHAKRALPTPLPGKSRHPCSAPLRMAATLPMEHMQDASVLQMQKRNQMPTHSGLLTDSGEPPPVLSAVSFSPNAPLNTSSSAAAVAQVTQLSAAHSNSDDDGRGMATEALPPMASSLPPITSGSGRDNGSGGCLPKDWCLHGTGRSTGNSHKAREALSTTTNSTHRRSGTGGKLFLSSHALSAGAKRSNRAHKNPRLALPAVGLVPGGDTGEDLAAGLYVGSACHAAVPAMAATATGAHAHSVANRSTHLAHTTAVKAELPPLQSVEDAARAVRAAELRRKLGVRSVTNYGHERDVQDYLKFLAEAESIVDGGGEVDRSGDEDVEAEYDTVAVPTMVAPEVKQCESEEAVHAEVEREEMDEGDVEERCDDECDDDDDDEEEENGDNDLGSNFDDYED